MNSKIFGIIICILLMTSYITIAENIEKPSTTFSSKKISNITNDVDAPIWTVDNYWNFKIDDMTIDYEQEGQYIHLTLKTNELQLNVIDVKTDSYIVDIDAVISGSGNAYIILEDGPINITLELRDTKLSGTIVFNKSDLGIKELNPKLVGRLLINIIEQPYIENYTIPSISIRATIDLSTNLATPLTIIDFPLNVSNIWGIPGTNVSLDGTIKSPWLYFINLIHNIARRPIPWLIVVFIANTLGIDEQTVKTISDMIYDILPIINISYVLQQYLEIGNYFEILEIPTIFICNGTENITIDGKTYNTYNISIIGGIGNIYYAPDAGNIVKISGYFKNIIPFISDLNIELMETNYTP